MEFLEIGLIELIDIALVAVLIYQLYKLVRGTVAINIFIGLAAIYLLWKIVDAFNFQLLSEILGQFIGVGVIILVIVFQQELRKFLMFIGKGKLIKNKGIFKFNFKVEHDNHLNTSAIAKACEDMAKTKTGAIIVLQRSNSLDFTVTENNRSNIKLMPQILESIFFKNSPLHDGAIIIEKNNIIATRVVLPVSDSIKMPSHYGLRHRAAQGISEKTDALVLVISEQTGKIVYVKNGEFFSFDSTGALRDIIAQDLSE